MSAPEQPPQGPWPQPAPPSGYAGPEPAWQPPARRPWNGFAVASLVLGVAWVWGFGSVLALIFGITALREIKRSQRWQQGRGMAIAGTILGGIGVALIGVVIGLLVAADDDDIDDDINIDIDVDSAECDRLLDEWLDAPAGSEEEADLEQDLEDLGCTTP